MKHRHVRSSTMGIGTLERLQQQVSERLQQQVSILTKQRDEAPRQLNRRANATKLMLEHDRALEQSLGVLRRIINALGGR